MIPGQIFCAVLQNQNRKQMEVRALEMAPDYFSFRLSRRREDSIREMQHFPVKLSFYERNPDGYREMEIREYRIRKTGEEEFWNEYRFETADPMYRNAAKQLLRDYEEYIDWKLNEPEEEISRKMTGYPVREDEIASSFREQKKRWFASRPEKGLKEFPGGIPDGMEAVLSADCGIGIALNEPKLWEAYLESDSWTGFLEKYRAERILSFQEEEDDDPDRVAERRREFIRRLSEKCRCLYIGNSFCPQLYPDPETLRRLYLRAGQDRKTLIPVFSTMSESLISVYQRRISEILEICGPGTEIVINDDGMLSMLRESGKTAFFHITYGVIPNRRRKDPRLLWKKDTDLWKIRKNMLNSAEFLEKLRDSGVERWSFETCGYVPELPGNTKSENDILYFPYYQMNTSTWCTTYAMCHNGKRGRQEPVPECPEYCREETFLYPDDLHMVGRFNSLFGLDAEAVRSGDRIREFLQRGIGRIVLNYL